MGFQVIEWGVAPRAEAGLAALALQGLDVLSFTAFSIADQCMDLGIGDPEVVTLWIGTGMPLGLDLFLASPAALVFRPGLDVPLDGTDGQLKPRLAGWAVFR